MKQALSSTRWSSMSENLPHPSGRLLVIFTITSLIIFTTTTTCDGANTNLRLGRNVHNELGVSGSRSRVRSQGKVGESAPSVPPSAASSLLGRRVQWVGRFRPGRKNGDVTTENGEEDPVSLSFPSIPRIGVPPDIEKALVSGKDIWKSCCNAFFLLKKIKIIQVGFESRPFSIRKIGLVTILGYAFISQRRRNRNRSLDGLRRNDKMTKGEIFSRVVLFWTKAAPVLVHYRFTQLWVGKIKKYDKDRRDDIYQNLHEMYAPRVLDITFSLRGLFIKVGQVASSRPDFMPHEYIEAFSSLQDNVPPFPGHQMKDIVVKSLLHDHGLHFDDVFDSFDFLPLGSASIGQVHAASLTPQFLRTLRQTQRYSGGPDVALKIMHFDARHRFANDFSILKLFIRLALPGWKPLLEELERQMMTEFDYLREAESLMKVRRNMASSPYRRRIVVPAVVEGLGTKNVLVMEMVRGEKFEVVMERKLAQIFSAAADGGDAMAKDIIARRRKELTVGTASPTMDTIPNIYRLVQAHFNSLSMYCQTIITVQIAFFIRELRALNDLILDVHGHQIFINGCFNGDPHPGNILLLEDGKIGLIDYGQCKELSDDERLGLSKIIKSLASFDKADDSSAQVVEAMHEFGFRFKYGKEDIITQVGFFCFDSDVAGKALGCATPQDYLAYLQSCDPMEIVPDAAVFVTRTSFLFRGMGVILGQHIHTSQKWAKHARAALLASEEDLR